jgi:hypothetical protein
MHVRPDTYDVMKAGKATTAEKHTEEQAAS